MLSLGLLLRGSSNSLSLVICIVRHNYLISSRKSNTGIYCSWSSYKINQVQDKIGVFVSIVSTKIPFKGTGKEYIGDDITEIASAVKVCRF